MRRKIASNSPYEPLIGFSRAVRAGNQVFVSGTVGRGADGQVVAGGVYEQTKQIIENIRAALEEAGATLSDVVRTRTYLVDIDTQGDFARAHREAFGEIRPASSLIEVSKLAAADMLVEMEADAVIGE